MASRFFALLAIMALGVAVIAPLVRLAGTAPSQLEREWEQVRLWFGAAVAITATLGSLYYSEIAGFVPCTLCWYQRILMYPLALILPVAAVRADTDIRIYVTPLAALGAAVATYHYILQWRPSLESGACAVDNPCSARWVLELGFVSIPFMALCGFLAILAAVNVRSRSKLEDAPEQAAVETVAKERA